MEVRGVEPRSRRVLRVEFSERSRWLVVGPKDHSSRFQPGPSGNHLARRSRKPPGASRISDALDRRGGNPPERTGYLSIRQPAPFVVWHLLCLPSCFARIRKPRLASDTAMTQRRIQVTPMSCLSRPLYNPPVTTRPPLFAGVRSEALQAASHPANPSLHLPRSSRSRITCRLSTLVRPLASATSSLAFPFRK